MADDPTGLEPSAIIAIKQAEARFAERMRLKAISDRVWDERGEVAIANMRENGCRNILIYCGSPNCTHSEWVNVDPLPDEMTLFDIQRMRLRCVKCDHIGGEVRPGYWNMTHLPPPKAKPWPTRR